MSTAARLGKRREREPGSRPTVCLCVCGSVAAVKLPELVAELADAGIGMHIVLTAAARHFVEGVVYKGRTGMEALRAVREDRAASIETWIDSDEWDGYAAVGVDPVLHVELATRSDALLLAPLDAHTLAKAALGLCDNLASCVVRAWPYGLDTTAVGAPRPKPILAAPAMNTVMWHQSLTHSHLSTLRARGVRVVEPISKLLACGDRGVGAMADVADIAAAVQSALADADAAAPAPAAERRMECR